MRDIEFRGYCLEDDRWTKGSLLKKGDCFFINPVNAAHKNFKPVDPETIGQYTGVNDKNGNKIFEGDILSTHYANAKKADFIETVVFKDGKFMAESRFNNGTGRSWMALPDGTRRFCLHWQPPPIYMEACEIIGNIFDNPELLNNLKERA